MSGLFLRPEMLALLVIAPIVAVVVHLFDRRRVHRLRTTLGPRLDRLATGPARKGRRARLALLTIATALALAVVAGPTWGDATNTVEQRGVDIVVALDVSRSMLAGDVEPNRLARARAEVKALAEAAVGDRFALVAFAGEARRMTPLTPDRATFVEFVERATPLSIGKGGTDLGAAIDAALEALEGGEGAHATILLLTDGEDHEGRAARSARRAIERGVTVHTIGFGSEQGAKIAIKSESGESFLRDRAGRDVVTAVDRSGLRRIAESGGGTFVDGGETGSLVGLHADRIQSMARRVWAESERRERPVRFQGFLIVAFLFWIAALARPEGSNIPRRRTWALRPAIVAAALFLPGCGAFDAAEDSYREGRFDEARTAFAALEADGGTPELSLAHALAALRAGDLEAASNALDRAGESDDPDVGAQADFIRGNIALERGALAAVQAASPEAEPFAWTIAINHAKRAHDAWASAATSREDWPQARRNVERARLRIEEYGRAKTQAEADRKRRSEPTPNHRILPNPKNPDGKTDPEKPDDEGPIAELSPEQVRSLIERLAEKEREKVEMRERSRAERSGGVEKDW